MKKKYQIISGIIIVVLMTMIPLRSMTQEAVKESGASTNTAPCYNYWSVGAFGGIMQFNGDLSRNLWVNFYAKSTGYTAGLVVTRQFSRVFGVRAIIAYGQVRSDVTDKWVWDYQDGNGTPQKITQSFSSTIYETDLQVTVNWLNWIRDYKPERIFSSYVFAGVGMDQSSGSKMDKYGTEISYLGREDEALNDGNTSALGGRNLQFKIVAGLGFDFNLSKHFSVPIELGWKWQNSDLLDMTRGGAKGVMNDMYSSGTVGLTYKFGYSCPKPAEIAPLPVPAAVPVVMATPGVRFFVYAPRNIPVERKIREIFPVRNYIFFNIGSTEIPDRYVLITKSQVKDFKEDQLDLFQPKNLSGRSDRQMVVYYNVLNILGDRMGKIPSATIMLVGSSESGPADGKALAESVKLYLTGVFGIDASRISTSGRDKPKIPSEQPGGTQELDLLREGDRRVSIESSSPGLLLEFQNTPDAPLKPIEVIAIQKAPLDSYVSVSVTGAKQAFSSWSLEITDAAGTVQNFGPYTQEMITIPGKSILGTQPKGTYKVAMTGQTKNGTIVKKDTTVNMVLWTPPANQEVARYSIIYEFNESKAIKMYEKYLTDIVIPKIPAGGTVVIHGYTDIIGDETYNQGLSLARSNDVKNILETGLSKAGRSDVQCEVYGFGEDPNLSPFENKYPEERFYNRTVFIDIMPMP